jgi:hypothetical protein
MLRQYVRSILSSDSMSTSAAYWNFLGQASVLPTQSRIGLFIKISSYLQQLAIWGEATTSLAAPYRLCLQPLATTTVVLVRPFSTRDMNNVDTRRK